MCNQDLKITGWNCVLHYYHHCYSIRLVTGNRVAWWLGPWKQYASASNTPLPRNLVHQHLNFHTAEEFQVFLRPGLPTGGDGRWPPLLLHTNLHDCICCGRTIFRSEYQLQKLQNRCVSFKSLRVEESMIHGVKFGSSVSQTTMFHTTVDRQTFLVSLEEEKNYIKSIY